MAVRIRLTWADNNVAETGHNIYRSDTPMDPEALPTALATLDADVAEYLDETVTEGLTYYYRVGAFNNTEELVSDEVVVEATVSATIWVVLRRITSISAHVHEYAPSAPAGVRGFHVSPDGIKGILCGFTSGSEGRGIASMTMPTPGNLLGMTYDHFWDAGQLVLGAKIYGADRKKAIVTLNNPWKVVRYSLQNEWAFSGTVTPEAEITALNGKSAGTFLIGSSGLWGIHYAFDTSWAALFTFPAPGAIESAQLQYSVDLAGPLNLTTGHRLSGVHMSDDGMRAWLFAGNFSSNSAGRIVQVAMSTPYDLRTLTVVSSISVPSGLFPAAHPVGWYEPARKLLLCHQASQRVREYNPSTVDW